MKLGRGGSSLSKEAQTSLSPPPQLIRGNIKAFPGQPIDIFSPAAPACTPGPPPSRTCLVTTPHPVGAHLSWLFSMCGSSGSTQTPFQKTEHLTCCLYPRSHSFSFKRTSNNSVNKKMRQSLTDLRCFSPMMCHLVAERTQLFTSIWYQFKCKAVRLNNKYIWFRLVTIATMTSRLVTHIPNGDAQFTPVLRCSIGLYLYAVFLQSGSN